MQSSFELLPVQKPGGIDLGDKTTYGKLLLSVKRPIRREICGGGPEEFDADLVVRRHEGNLMKIVLLIDFLQSVFGGTERHIFELCKNIDRRGFEPVVACLSKGDRFLEQIENRGIKTVGLKVERIYSMEGLRRGLWFRDMLKRENVDVLMTHHFGSDIWGTIFGRMAGVPVIVSNRRDAGFWRERRHIFVYRLLRGWVDKIVVVSGAVKEMVLKEENVREGKIEIIFNGIDMQRFNNVSDAGKKREELQVPQGAKLIGCVGNMRPVKGHRYLVEAAKVIVPKFRNAHFVFIGGGKLRSDMIKMSRDLGLESNVHFPGIRDDIPELLACMDICVLPSLSEGFSNTLLEYMAAGKPIVATRAGGNSEVILDQTNGLLAKKADHKDLAEKILCLLRDEQKAERFGVEARYHAERRFSVEKMAERYQVLLQDLAGHGN